MFSTAVEDLVVRHSAARFADPQGYRLEGDEAHLHAGVTVDAGAPDGADWALQLWACEPGGLRGIKVAELPVGCLPAAGMTSVEGWTTALPPAGQAAHTMVLALASGAAGFFDRIHDLAVFPVEAQFRQPCLQAPVTYRFEGGEVEVCVGCVANPRDADNLSGSLGLELWALPQPYEGGAFAGFLIAGGELGRVAGQAGIEALRLTLPAAAPPPGSWHIVLMLREWTPAGFLTRDYVNFSAAHEAAESPVSAAAPEAVAAPAAAEAFTPAAAPAKSAGRRPAQTAATGPVSINRATAEELAAIKGLGKAVAAAIVAGRPYAGLDEVLRAKGVGPRLLEKLRDRLAL